MVSLVSKMYGDLSINFPVRKQGHDTIMHPPFSPSIILYLIKFSATSLFSNYDFVYFDKNVFTVID